MNASVFFPVPEPVRFEDFAEFQLDIDRIMREHGMDPNDFRNGAGRTSSYGTVTCWTFLLVTYLFYIRGMQGNA